jgi:hypothetical protein
MSEQATTAPKDYTIKGARIVRVSSIDKSKTTFADSDKRVFLLLDEEFASYDKDGNECQTDTLTIDRFALAQQVCKCDPDSTLAAMLSATLGDAIKPELFAAAIQGANVDIKRVFHAENELRQDGTSVYSHNCFTSEIINFSERINKIASKMIDKAIETNSFTNDTEDEKEKRQISLSQKWQW